MKILRIIGILVGLSVVGYLVHEVGWTAIRHTLGLLGWGYLVVLSYPVSWILLNTTGWFWALHAQYSRISIFRLAQIRTAGETFNSLLPSGYVGGEPLKAKLLGGSVPLREATSSVLIAKSAQSIALVVYVVLGLSLGQSHHASPLQQRGTWVALSFLTVGITIFSVLLTRRSFSRLGHWLHRVTHAGWIQRQEHHLAALDGSLGNFYREGKLRFLLSILFHLLGWLAGAMEVAVIFWFIDHPLGWRQAWFIGAMAQLASVIGLIVPAGVGLYEGGHYMAASLLGLDPALGLSVSLIRRVREVFWDGVGLWIFWRVAKVKPSPASASASLGKERVSL